MKSQGIHSRFSSTIRLASAFAVTAAACWVSGIAIANAEESVLLTKQLGSTQGEATVAIHPDIAAGATTSGKHYHLGDQIVYILEGTGTLQVEGQPPLSLKPGVTFYIAPRQVHEVTTTGGPLKGLGVTIAKSGEPLVVPVK